MATETQVIAPELGSTAPSLRYWRIRMKYGAKGDNVTKEAWQEGIAGIWYGAWNPKQFEKTLSLHKREAMRILTRINTKAGLDWPVKSNYLDTARRFWMIRSSCSDQMNNAKIERRTFLQGVSLAALGAAVNLDAEAQVKVPNSRGTELPKLKAPALACDCHHHIYDTARFPPHQPFPMRVLRSTACFSVASVRDGISS
jgi:hypothetical protein